MRRIRESSHYCLNNNNNNVKYKHDVNNGFRRSTNICTRARVLMFYEYVVYSLVSVPVVRVYYSKLGRTEYYYYIIIVFVFQLSNRNEYGKK